MNRLVLLAFLASGASGLIFQISWVRQLGHVFGNTTQSAAVVTGVFVLALGVGAALAGRFADRAHGRSPTVMLSAYAALEVFIGAWGLALMALLPALAETPFPPSSYVVDERGWHEGSALTYALQVVVAALLVAPPALAMGATLVVLLRAALRTSLARVASSTGLLYAVNTAGASLGALLVDTTLVPALGISGAQAVSAGLNLLAAALALRAGAPLRAAPLAPCDDATALSDAPRARAPALFAAVMLAGVTGMGLEIVWFRYLSSLLGAHRATFSLILAVLLLGIWLGSASFGALAQRTGRPLMLFVLAQAALVVTTVAGALLPAAHVDGATFRELLVPVLVVVGVPSLCLGTAFPLANAALQQRLGEVGRLAGRLYLVNALGGLAGSCLAGFVLVPLLGMQRALLLLVATGVVTLLLIAPAAFREGGRKGMASPRARAAVRAGGLAATAAVTLLATLPKDALLRRVYSRDDVRAHAILYAEGLTESIAVTERADLGEEPERILYVDGVLMSGTLPGPQRYMRAMAHVPLLQMAAPRRALVICFGVGNTAHAVSLHPSIERLEIADLSRQILEHGHLFERWNGGVLEDPRTRVFVHDGRQHLRMQEEGSYDLITLEPPPIAQAGVGSLYAREFYALGESRLRDGGFLTQWLPAYQVRSEAALSMVRAFLDVFPNAVLLSGFERHLLLVGRKGALNTIDPEALRRALEERPAVQEDLARLWLGSPRALLGSFAADAATLAAATEGVPPATDDWPVSEYSMTLLPQPGGSLPAALFDVSTLPSWCPRCVDERGAPLVDGLGETLAFLGAWYESEHFRIARGATRAPPMKWRLQDPEGRLRALVDKDPYLSSLLDGNR